MWDGRFLVGKVNWVHEVSFIILSTSSSCMPNINFLEIILFLFFKVFHNMLIFFRLQSWRNPSVIHYLVVQVFVVFTALSEVHRNKHGLVLSQDSWWARFSLFFERLGI